MKKHLKKILAVVLCFAMILPLAPAAFAAEYENDYVIAESDGTKNVNKITKGFYNAVDKIIKVLVKAINLLVPAPKSWESSDNYSSDGFMAGSSEFLSEPADGAQWSLGYGEASLLEGQNIMDGNHYVAGSLSVKDKLVTSVSDDLKVRTIAIDDGSSRGITVFAVIDGYGMSLTDVRGIRLSLADYCKEMNITSLNISVLHQHSAVDTFGMNGPLLKELGNGFRNISGKAPVNGQNKEYMENLYKVTGDTVKAAVESMKTGKLYYAELDMTEYVRDKRPPYVLDTNFDRFRFVPDDGSRGTVFSTSPIHCVGYGAGGTDVTGDYPYYMEQAVNEMGYNFLLILDAEQGTSQVHPEECEGLERPENLKVYGEVLANVLMQNADENEVAPLLNIKNKEVKFSIDNPILTFAGKMGLVTNKVLNDKGKLSVLSEIGYMEIGNDLAVALVPGELAAEIAYGGFLTSETSWTNTDWTKPTLQEITGDRHMLVFGLMNDQIGYIIPGNDFMSVIYPANKSLELVSLGDQAAAQLTDYYAELVAECK